MQENKTYAENFSVGLGEKILGFELAAISQEKENFPHRVHCRKLTDHELGKGLQPDFWSVYAIVGKPNEMALPQILGDFPSKELAQEFCNILTLVLKHADKTDPFPGWTCTDEDKDQYGIQYSADHFSFFEKDFNTKVDIKISDYTFKEIEEAINPYGYTQYPKAESHTNIFNLYPDTYLWIIAECLFETIP